MEALEQDHPGKVETSMVDVFKEYAPPPLDKAPDFYPDMARFPNLWGLGYRISDGPHAAYTDNAIWPLISRAAHRLVREQDADCVVSVHPLFNAIYLRAAGVERPPFMTVVTDLVTAHRLWYHPDADLCIVPTQAAAERAREEGVGPEKVRVLGLPVAQRFCVPEGDPRVLRKALGWPQGCPMVLLVGGGEGMGPLEGTAKAIDRLELDFGLAVVAGRNTALKSKLMARDWAHPTFIYGFEQRMPDMMRAASLLVTKAGPGTITEALNAGLPMVLYSYLPGQETGNIEYVIDADVGLWAPGVPRTAEAVQWWLTNPDRYDAAVSACKRAARPNAARDIAAQIVDLAYRGRSRPLKLF